MKRRIPALGAGLVLAMTAGVLVPVASPAQADVPIFGDVAAVVGVVQQIKSTYDALINYLTDPATTSELDQIKAAITQSATMIDNQIDATATGMVKEKCDDIVVRFEDIDTTEGDQLDSLRNDSVDCVNAAKEQILAQVSPKALDADALALNIGAPIAIATSVKEHKSTDLVIDAINDGNKALLANQALKPVCGVTANAGVDVEATTLATTGPIPGTGGEAPIPGHGACYSYLATAPQKTEGDVIYFPTGPNTGALPWTVTGDGEEEFCAGVFTCGHAKVTWPSTASWDFSIAADRAMAATSYPIVEAALDKMGALPGPNGNPITMVSETGQIYSPIDVFGVGSSGQLVRGVLNDTSTDDLTNGTFAHDTFLGWQSFDGPAFSPNAGGPGYTMKSLASAVTWDGHVQVFALDRVGNLFTRWQLAAHDDTQWSSWAHLDGTLNSIAVARNQDGRLQLFGSTPAGTVVTRVQLLNTFTESAGPYVPQGSNIHPALDAWQPWQTMNVNGPTIQVAADSLNNVIHLYGLESYGSLVERHETAVNAADYSVAGNWSAWAAVPSPSVGGSGVALRSVQAFTDSAGFSNLLVTANSSAQYQLLADTGNWVQIPGAMFGGFGANKEGGGAGSDEMFGVDKSGNVFYSYSNGSFEHDNTGFRPDHWSQWSPVSGATLRGYEPGPYMGPLLNSVVSTVGSTALSWTDESTNEDAFAVFRYRTNGQYVSEATDQATTDKAGSGRTVTFTDNAPNTAAPCYQVDAYDYAGSFVAGSDIVCPAPGVVGLTQSAATSAITAAGLTLGTVSTVNNCVNTGTVQTQNPAGGTRVAWATPVAITVSTCNISAPNVLGLTQSAATSAITAGHFTLGTVSTINNCVSTGTVRSQSPTAGTSAPPGSAVNITVSTCTVPNVLGADFSSSTLAINVAGLVVGTAPSVNNCVNPGTVWSTNPSVGTAVSPGSTVTITMTTCTVPNVLSFDQTSAVNSIHAVGLNVHIGSINNCLDPGTVQSESPSAGASVAPGSTVNLTISTCTGGGSPK